MTKFMNVVANYLFPEVETAKEVCVSDWCWLLSLPLFGSTVLLYLVLHI